MPAVPRKRHEPTMLPSERPWSTRTSTLVGDLTTVDRVCRDWTAEGWQVLTVDVGPPTPGNHPTFVVRVAVPPLGWRTNEQLLSEPQAAPVAAPACPATP